jgi:hypothetical protein
MQFDHDTGRQRDDILVGNSVVDRVLGCSRPPLKHSTSDRGSGYVARAGDGNTLAPSANTVRGLYNYNLTTGERLWIRRRPPGPIIV